MTTPGEALQTSTAASTAAGAAAGSRSADPTRRVAIWSGARRA